MMPKAALALISLMAAFTLAHAQSTLHTVKVGRATLELPAGDWREVNRQEVQAATVEDNRGRVLAERVTLVLSDAGAAQLALTLVASAGGTGRRVQWLSACAPSNTRTWWHRLPGGSPDDLACIAVSAAVDAAALAGTEAALPPSISLAGSALARPVVRIQAKLGAWTGMFMAASLVLPSDFAGTLPAEADTPNALPDFVAAGHARFALQLGQRLRDCLYSISGRMVLPALSFAAQPAPSKT